MPMQPVISIVDDDELVREGTTDFFKAIALVAVALPSAADFLKSKHLHNTSCLIADVQKPGFTARAVALVGSLVAAWRDPGNSDRLDAGDRICRLPDDAISGCAFGRAG